MYRFLDRSQPSRKRALAGGGGGGGGGSVTITGTGFGTKSSASPFFWQPFSTTVAPTGSGDLTSIGYSGQYTFGSNSYGNSLEVITNAGRTSSVGAVRYNISFTGAGDRDYFPHVAVDTSNTGLGSLNSQQVYYSFWAKLTKTSGTYTGVRGIQMKSPRLGWAPNTSTNYYASPPRYSSSFFFTDDAIYDSIYQEVVRTDGTDDGAEGFNFSSYGWVKDGWNYIEGWAKFNDIGSANGFWIQKINGNDTNPGFPDAGNSRAISARDATESSKLITFLFLNPGIDFNSNTTTVSFQAFFSEHYIDTTPQRVVMTDNSTYSSSTKWTVQKCTSWSNTSVTITTPDYTGFTSGATVYFHVFGVSNTVITAQSAVVP